MILPTRYKMKPPPSAKPIKSILKKLGCVGLWVMNENGGLSVIDLSGNGNDGTFGAGAASPIWSAGKFGSALSFDGGDYVDCGNKSVLNMTSAISMCAWVNIGTGVIGNNIIIGKHDQGDATAGYRLYIDDNFLKIRLYNLTNAGYTGSIDLSDSLWHHVAGTWDGSTITLLVDGKVDGTPVASTGTLGIDARHFMIGAEDDEIPIEFFTGQIDAPMLYNRGLIASEIALLYQYPFFMFGRKRTVVTIPALPPEVSSIYMDLTSQIWTIKHSKGLFTKL